MGDLGVMVDAPIADDLLTVEQVATMFDCSAETIELETREGRLPGVKLGRSWRYPRAALMRVLNERAIAEMERRAPPPPGVTPLPEGRRGRRQTPPQLPAAASRAAKS
jgi:excisionase family DNA binding protein